MTSKYKGISMEKRDASILSELENIIGESIPKVDEINRLTFGYKLKNNKLVGLSIIEKELRQFPESILNLESLETLNLRTTQLESIPEKIDNLRNLVNLLLIDNNIKSLPENICNLSNLKVLNVALNPLTSVPNNIGNLANLIVLCFNNTK
ncbi:MAG: hypothetical protein FK730_14710, partial [Asgard group archaeon]|nr:hypothetical protein [Asgard group archaeon]